MEKAVTKIVNKDTFDRMSLMNRIASYVNISEKKVLVSYYPYLHPEIIASHGLDIVKLARKYKDEETQTNGVTSIAISAAITAYGRIHISKLKLDLLNRGGNIYILFRYR